MARYTTAVLAFCCVLVTVVTAGDSTGKCSAKMLGKLEDCCDIPKLLKGEAFTMCLNGSFTCDAVKETTNGKGQWDAKSYPGGPLCLMTCALCYFKALTATHDVNITAIANRFNNMSDDAWKPVVKSAISNCTDEYNKANLTALNSVGGCKPGPVLFITCVRRYLMLDCPKKHLNTKDKNCSKRLTKLRDCDPFSMKIDHAAQKNKKGKHQGKKAAQKSDSAATTGKSTSKSTTKSTTKTTTKTTKSTKTTTTTTKPPKGK